MLNPIKKLKEALDNYNNYLESINDRYRYVLTRKIFTHPKPIEFLVIDECSNDIDTIQTYIQVNNAISYLKKMRIKDIQFEKFDTCIKKALCAHMDNVYELIKSEYIHRIEKLGEIKYNIIVKSLSNIGLDTQMTTSDILKSNFFLENKDKFEQTEIIGHY